MKKNKNEEAQEQDEYLVKHSVFNNTRYILSMMHKYKKGLIFLTLLNALMASVSTYLDGFIGKYALDFIQKAIMGTLGGAGQRRYVHVILVLLGIFLVVGIIYAYTDNNIWFNFIYVRMNMCRLRIEKALRMNYQTLEDPKMLDRMEKAMRATGGNNNGVEGMMRNFYYVSLHLISFLFASAILSSLNVFLILFILLISAIQFYLFNRAVQYDKKKTWDELSPYNRKENYLQQIGTDFSYAKEIRIYRMREWLAKKHLDVLNIILEKRFRSTNMWIRYDAFEKITNMIRDAVIYGYLIYRILYTNMDVGNFYLYITSAMNLSNTVISFFKELGNYRRASVETDDFRCFVSLKDSWEERKTQPLPAMSSYEFKFEDVSFRYPNQEVYALRHLNLTIKAGKRLAVVGLNGAGKTTMIKLLLRLYDVTEGRILLNGIDIRDYDKVEYFRLFAPVFQDVKIFAFPISENVSMKDLLHTDCDKAEHTLKQAGFGEKLASLTKGVHTELLKILHDDGVDLSGGEKQKLALARALYKEAPVIVLDEPTAALDALAEYKLYHDFDQLIGEKTAVYISHRLSSTRFCDQIAMFMNGELVEIGTHEELLKKGGEYAKMFQVQAQYYEQKNERG